MNEHDHPSPRHDRACAAVVVALLLLANGCSKPEPPPSRGSAAGAEAPTKASAGDDFFVTWLEAHGETSVVTDAGGVGVAGNPTRLRGARSSLTEHKDSSSTVMIQFRARLPARGEIVESLPGYGASPEAADDDARKRFANTTLDLIYRGFIKSPDPQKDAAPVTINGLQRTLVLGELSLRGRQGDLGSISAQIEKLIAALPLSAAPHWFKIVYSQADGVPNTVEVTLDNANHPGMVASLGELPWPKQTELYTFRRLIVVR